MGYVLERRQVVNRSRGEVFAFFADAANLERLTTGSMHFHRLTPLPLGLLGRVVHALFVDRQLRHIFDFRQKVIAGLFR